MARELFGNWFLDGIAFCPDWRWHIKRYEEDPEEVWLFLGWIGFRLWDDTSKGNPGKIRMACIWALSKVMG